MAVLEFKFASDLWESIDYAAKERGENDVTHYEQCSEETVLENFHAVKKLHGKEDGVQVLKLIQSWHPNESDFSRVEEYNQMGQELVNTLYPGHQYFVRTHTDKGHIHNHIVINTVHPETGARIYNKKVLPNGEKFVHHLRKANDKICIEHGFSVLNREKQERDDNKPFKVKRMERFKKNSYVLDLLQKADFGRAYATSHDEYASILQEFGIRVQVEKKNITYFYPGDKKGNRGRTLGKMYDKAGLEKAYKRNDEMFASKPGIRDMIRGQIDDLKSQPGQTRRDKNGNILSASSSTESSGKDYTAFTKTARKGRASNHYSDREFNGSLVPIDEIRRARKSSIFDYCKQNKIELTKNKNGETVLKGREHVMIVSETEWKNKKNRTSGSLIELVSAHKDLTFLQAIAQINRNPRLLLLEQNFGEKKHKFKSFYVPKHESADIAKSLGELSKFLSSSGANPKTAGVLLNRKQAQVGKKGVIRLFGMGDSQGAMEFTPDDSGQYKRKTQGKIKAPFFNERGSSSKATIFTDPFTFMHARGADPFKTSSGGHGVLALLEPDKDLLDQFVAGNPHLKSLHFVPPKGRDFEKSELDFFNILQSRYKPFGITIETRGLDKSLSRPGPDLSL